MRGPSRRDKKAISPVIATIIIVAVAIVMSIAVAYWVMGLGTMFTRYEKLEFTTVYRVPTESGWDITITVKNTGTLATTIEQILINEIPYGQIQVNNTNITVNPTPPVLINPGNEARITISIPRGDVTVNGQEIGVFSSGGSITITVKTAAGYDYPKTVTLP